MAQTLYILTDRIAIDYILNGSIDELKEYLSDPENYVELSDPITFETEAEAVAFGAGLGFGKDERGEVEQLILNTTNPDDVEVINLIEGLQG